MTIEESGAAIHARGESVSERQGWLSLLARASVAELEQTLLRLSPQPRYEFLRRAEPGMVMLRARMGGTGDPFNLGETSVTRCSVRLSGGCVGTGYVLGRERRKAEKRRAPRPRGAARSAASTAPGGPARAEERGRWGATLDDWWCAAGP